MSVKNTTFKIRHVGASYDRCGACNATLPDNAKVCWDCGALFVEENRRVEITPLLSVQSPVFQPKKCPLCGEPMGYRAKLCKPCSDRENMVALRAKTEMKH